VRFLLATVVVALAVFSFLPVVFGTAPEQKTPEPSKASAPPASAAVPVAEVATRATEVSNLLRTLNAQLAPSPEIERIKKSLSEEGEDIAQELLWTMNLFQGQPALATIQAQQELWQRRQHKVSKWLDLLTQRATLLQDALNRLANLQETWNQTP
jgi:hypothetical protein